MKKYLHVGCVAAAFFSTACGFVVTGDDALADEFAEFKANGGKCTSGTPPPPAGGALSSATRFSWRVFDGLLLPIVDEVGDVRYRRFLNDVEERDAARVALEHLAQVDPSKFSSSGEKLAFWVNAYNLLVLTAAAARFEADPAFRVDEDGFAFFDLRAHTVGGRTISMNEIEHGILRGSRFHSSTGSLPDEEWEALFALHKEAWDDGPPDPRVHFVLNCASQSCPPLPLRPLTGPAVIDEMDAATAAFLADEEVGASSGGISELFAFYQEDFDAVGGVQAFIERYRPTANIDLGRFLAYDWALNRSVDDEP